MCDQIALLKACMIWIVHYHWTVYSVSMNNPYIAQTATIFYFVRDIEWDEIQNEYL